MIKYILVLLLLSAPLYACKETRYICYTIGDPHSAETEESFKEQIEYMKEQGWAISGGIVVSNVPKPKLQSYQEYNKCQEMTRDE